MTYVYDQAAEDQRQHLAETLWHREHPVCQSMLVSSLLSFDSYCSFSFDEEDIENLYPDPSEWQLNRCISWLDEHAVDYSDLEKDDPEQFRDEVRDYSDPQDILEWWAVSSWFADKLREHGECILDNDYGIWWGRTCSGQSVVLDGVIQAIAVETLTSNNMEVLL